jgi:hypothetical protein
MGYNPPGMALSSGTRPWLPEWTHSPAPAAWARATATAQPTIRAQRGFE